MFCAKITSRLQVSVYPLNFFTRQLSSTSICYDKRWRLQNGYPKHWSDRGILTDGPDFTYSNGKITPYTNGQRARLLEQKQYAEKILFLLKAVKYAKESYQERIANRVREKQVILDKKLKPKGNLLKRKKSVK